MKNEKGFTLIEILAVIVILGIIMIIAIPAVSQNIMDSRKSTYITSIQKYIEAAKNEIATFNYTINNDHATYYIPTRCLGTENGEVSPFGDMMESYVVVTFDVGGHFEYYYAGRDETNHGMGLTKSTDINEEALRDDVTVIRTNVAIPGRDIIIKYKDDCSGQKETSGTATNISCGRTVGESTGWTYEDREITVECTGNCKANQKSVSKTFNTTTKEGTIIIYDATGRESNSLTCSVDVYVDKSKPKIDIEVLSGHKYKFKKDLTDDSITNGYVPSGIKMYYCVDAENICKPDIEVQDNATVDAMVNLIGTYYVRFSISTGAGYTSSTKSYTANVSPKLNTETNLGNKTIKFIIDGYASGDTVKYCLYDQGGVSCTPNQSKGQNGVVTGESGKCIKYYLQRGSNKTLEKNYCFY